MTEPTAAAPADTDQPIDPPSPRETALWDDEVGPRGCRRYFTGTTVLCKSHADLRDCRAAAEPDLTARAGREGLDLREAATKAMNYIEDMSEDFARPYALSIVGELRRALAARPDPEPAAGLDAAYLLDLAARHAIFDAADGNYRVEGGTWDAILRALRAYDDRLRP